MKLTRVVYAASALCLAGLVPAGRAQNPPAAPVAPQAATEALRVFHDCHGGCDFDFVRREINYVNWVRDPSDADVHLIVTSQRTGGGGDEYTLRYIGLRGYQGMDEELKIATRQSDTDEEIRKQVTQRIALGLARYLVRGPLAGQLQLTFTGNAAAPAQQPHDPWNLWVFGLGLGGSLSSESQIKSNRISGNLRAGRVSERWKFQVSGNANRSHSTYTLSNDSLYKTTTASYNTFALLARSLGEHWSAGVEGSAGRSTRDNYDLNFRAAAELEFDVFPYRESSKRQFVLVYSLGMRYANYRDTTIFNKLVETRPVHSLTAAVSAVQPWGSLEGSVVGSSYLDNFSQNRLSVFAFASVRIIRGLSLFCNIGYSRVRDQLSLLKTGLTNEEILLQLKQLKTLYSLFGSINLNYTFGSKFNNIVNPRFSNSGGGGGNCECFGGSCFCQ